MRKSRDGAFTYAEFFDTRKLLIAHSPLPTKSSDDVTQEVEIQLKYEGYIARDIEQIDGSIGLRIKAFRAGWTTTRSLRSVSNPDRSRLDTVPTPLVRLHEFRVHVADIAILLVWIKRAGEVAA